MAEIGWVTFARLALEISEAVLASHRTKFSKRQFTQPQLLAVLCLMRYEDWTFRDAEVRLREHAELRSALRLRAAPDYTTLYRFLLLLEEVDVAQAMREIVRRMPGRWRSPATVAVDATGRAPSAVSSQLWPHIDGIYDFLIILTTGNSDLSLFQHPYHLLHIESLLLHPQCVLLLRSSFAKD